MSLKDLLKNVKLKEETIKAVTKSLIVVVLGILLVNFFQKNKGQTIPGLQIGDESTLSSTHTVANGEDLWSISEKYYGTGFNWTKIAEANDLVNPNIITEGQKLTIPGDSQTSVLGQSPSQEESNDSPEVVANETKVHKVEKDENLWIISEKYYKSGYNWVDIASENKISNASHISVGQELILPDVQPKPTTTVVTEVLKIDGDTYTVEKGDNLWEIAVRAYGDGYKWPEISSKNKLKNPGIITPGQVLSLPR